MWKVLATDTFLKELKKHKKEKEIYQELDAKVERLKEDPHLVGGNLAGKLHGYKSTRLSRIFRLIFSIDEEQHVVYLQAIDHRKDVYGKDIPKPA